MAHCRPACLYRGYLIGLLKQRGCCEVAVEKGRKYCVVVCVCVCGRIKVVIDYDYFQCSPEWTSSE